MSKTLANQILKTHGNDFVRFKSTGFTFDTPPCHTVNGKRVKGIYFGSTGPLTVTNAVDQQKVATLRDLVTDLQKVVKRVTDNQYIVAETSKSITYLDLYFTNYPSYQHSAGYDEGYRSHYIVPSYYTEKK